MTRVGQASDPRIGHLGCMPLDGALNELVLFEIPGFDRAMQLCELVGSEWLAWVQNGEGIRRVAVMIQPEEGDLAVLLRLVERWVAEQGIVAIRFELDGRTYVLESGQAVWSQAAA
jgi:hypothetical protein